MISPQKLAGVIGFPIAHSRSPRLHGHWLRVNGIEGYYVPLQVAPDDFAECLRLLPRLGFVGANVTTPHKETALTLADHRTDVADRIGAANTLSFTAKGIVADNTDAHGFTWNILESCPQWKPKTAAIVGAGGACRAVIVALLSQGVENILISNRSAHRADKLAHDFGPSITVVPWQERSEMLDGCDTLVNTTSLGMSGNAPLDLALDALPTDALVNDLVYSPLETELLNRARMRGNVVVDGLGMLLHQAAPGFARWFGVVPTVDAALRQAILESP